MNANIKLHAFINVLLIQFAYGTEDALMNR